MLDILPAEIRTHVHVLSNDQLFLNLVPRHRGATNNPCFFLNDEKTTHASVEIRPIAIPLPDELRVVYERYSDDTEFSTQLEWTFLSEQEIMTRKIAMEKEGQTQFVDIAISYAGMGHVQVLSYVKSLNRVFMHIDGGANGWDRETNHKQRMDLSMEDVSTVPFRTWWVANCQE